MIDVLLATYKADKAMLKAQVDSIRAQRDVEVNLMVREDVRGEGAARNFAALLEQSRAGYVAFADQDDVWMEDKLARSMVAMRELERRYGSSTPLLVFTDSIVVDAGLSELDRSFFARGKIDPARTLPNQLIMQNVASGNTMLFNAALRDKALPIPPQAFMHDHWLMLTASVFGKIVCLREPTLLYRQHGGNVLGGAKVDARYFLGRLAQGLSAVRSRLYVNIRQAEAFANRFGDQAPPCFRACCGWERKNWPVRRLEILRHGLFKHGLVRNLGMLLVA